MSTSPDLERQRRDERQAVGEKGRSVEEGKGGSQRAGGSWKVSRRRAGSWLPLALFASKSSLERFESETVGESGVDPEGVIGRGRA